MALKGADAEQHGMIVELRILHSHAPQPWWKWAFHLTLALLTGSGGTGPEVRVRVRHIDGDEVQSFVAASWRRARRHQADIVAALSSMSDAEVADMNSRRGWDTVA